MHLFPQRWMDIVLHFSTHAIRQGQLSGVVKFKKIYDADGDREYIALLPKDIREGVICVPPRPLQPDSMRCHWQEIILTAL